MNGNEETGRTSPGHHSRQPTDIDLDDTARALARPQGLLGGPSPEERQAAVPRFTLVVIAHPDSRLLGHCYEIAAGSDLLIGRSPEADIQFPELQELSRQHARIWEEGGTVRLEDRSSHNGTFVNGRRLRETARLVNGDRVQMATVIFKLLGGGNVEHAYHEAMYELVTRDELTHLYNRRKLEDDLRRELACAVRYGRPLVLILFDLDRFKEVNDRHGHLAGDAVLEQLATLAAPSLRRETVFARLGGDEFAILCPETSLDGASVLAERLRRRIAGHHFPTPTASISLTCSFGLAGVTPLTTTPQDLYADADRALYRAKLAGGNSVVVSLPESEEGERTSAEASD